MKDITAQLKRRLERAGASRRCIVPPFTGTGDVFADIRRDVELLEAARSIDDLPDDLRRAMEIIGRNVNLSEAGQRLGGTGDRPGAAPGTPPPYAAPP